MYEAIRRALGPYRPGAVCVPPSATPLGAAIPFVPSNLASIASGSDMTFTFDTPSRDGGHPISRCAHAFDRGEAGFAAGAGTASPLTVSRSDAIACVPSSFDLRLVNAVGSGPATVSPSDAVTPGFTSHRCED